MICPFITRPVAGVSIDPEHIADPFLFTVECLKYDCMAWVKVPDSTVKGIYNEYCALIWRPV